MEKLTEEEWFLYRSIKEGRQLTGSAQKLIASIHARIFKHSFYLPCTCSGKTWQQWISQINTIYERGHK